MNPVNGLNLKTSNYGMAAKPVAQPQQTVQSINLQLQGMDPDSSDAQQLHASLGAIQNQGKPVGALYAQLAKLEPDSPEAQELKKQIAGLQQPLGQQQQAPQQNLLQMPSSVGMQGDEAKQAMMGILQDMMKLIALLIQNSGNQSANVGNTSSQPTVALK